MAGLVEWLPRETLWTVAADGGFGSRLAIRHEPGAGGPVFLRDGVPVGTGHRWADDPWTVAITGRSPRVLGYGDDGWGGDGGVIDLLPAETDTSVAVVDTRFFKGNHETYLRSVSARTPMAVWRFRLDFEELLDQQGYDHRVPGESGQVFASRLGESKFRSSRVGLVRSIADGGSLELSYERVRKHKTGIPADSLLHEEIWADNAVLTWRDRTALGEVRTSIFVSGADVERDRTRKLETLREGALVELTGSSGASLDLNFSNWNVIDNAAGVSDWLPQAAAVDAEGQYCGLRLAASVSAAGWRIDPGIQGRWESRAGFSPAAEIGFAREAAGGGLRLVAGHGGRAPTSFEMLTPDRVFVLDRALVLLPDPDLDWERTTRFTGEWTRGMAGFDLRIGGSYRILRDGIGWRADRLDPDRGVWANDVEMDGWTATIEVGRTWRLAGLARLDAHFTRRGWDVSRGTPMGLPPERSAGLSLFWERRLFHEDGVFEVGYNLEHGSERDDPLLPRSQFTVPAATRHDLLLAFRLLGADLGLELRNLTDENIRLSSGAVSDGREMRWRLEWSFTR